METRYWRIRARGPKRRLFDEEFAEHGIVGIWYGGWSADDWAAARDKDTAAIAKALSSSEGHASFDWTVPKSFIDTARRFDQIRESDWVVLCDALTITMCRIGGPMKSSADHPLNHDGQVLKHRPIVSKKTFQLDSLPDVYRLLKSAGRGNVHQFHSTNRRMVQTLADAEKEVEVWQSRAELPVDDWLAHLSPSEWESLCLGYLIQEESYLPTGLTPGRTLATYDIVGVNAITGHRIYAQCKNARSKGAIAKSFANAARHGSDQGGHYYYFTYGGVSASESQDTPANLTVVTGEDIKLWASEGEGVNYIRAWREGRAGGVTA